MSTGYRKLYEWGLLISIWTVISLMGINCVKMMIFEVKCGHPHHEGEDTQLQVLPMECTQKSLEAWYTKHNGGACYGYLCTICK